MKYLLASSFMRLVCTFR